MAEKILVDEYTAMQESMMLGLRLTREGVSKSEFQIRHQADMSIVFQKEIEKILRRP